MMTLKTKRWSLRAVTLALVALAAVVLVAGWRHGDSGALNAELDGTAPPIPKTASDLTADAGLAFDSLWDKRLQQVLYDPPPPPPKEVVKTPPPPLNVKLLGTMINERNSQAIIEDAQRNVVFRREGEAVSSTNPDAIIEKILSNSIEVRRGEDLTTLNTE